MLNTCCIHLPKPLIIEISLNILPSTGWSTSGVGHGMVPTATRYEFWKQLLSHSIVGDINILLMHDLNMSIYR